MKEDELLKSYAFQAELHKHDGMDAAYIHFPYDVQQEFGTKGQVKVKAVFQDGTEYRGSLANMGLDCHCLGIPKRIREQLGVTAGEVLSVTITPDTEPRVVELPEPLKAALESRSLESRFRNLSYSKQKQAAESVESAKKPETLAKRVQSVIDSLLET